MLIIYAGKNSFMWFGPTPRVILTDPELVKEVFNKIYDFQKPNTNPLVRILATGLIIHEGEKWNKHRKIINPAFHLEKLKVSFSLLDINFFEFFFKKK
jgi:cytochrome P450